MPGNDLFLYGGSEAGSWRHWFLTPKPPPAPAPHDTPRRARRRAANNSTATLAVLRSIAEDEGFSSSASSSAASASQQQQQHQQQLLHVDCIGGRRHHYYTNSHSPPLSTSPPHLCTNARSGARPVVLMASTAASSSSSAAGAAAGGGGGSGAATTTTGLTRATGAGGSAGATAGDDDTGMDSGTAMYGSASTAAPPSTAAASSSYATAAARAVESATFFQPLLVADDFLRQPATEDIISQLRVSALGDQELLRAHLLTAVRLATEAPFPDVRDGFSQFLQFLHKEMDCELPPTEKVSPSRFVPRQAVSAIDAPDADVAELLQQTFLLLGRVSHMNLVLAWHPKYLASSVESQYAITRKPAPLPRSWRHYLGIMAAARYQCLPLITSEAAQFLDAGGDPEWLKGLKFVPTKLANLAELNALLAHRPWLLTKEHIAGLVRGKHAWSVTELACAMVVLCHYTAVSCLVWGMGIEPEVDLRADAGVSTTVTAAAAAATTKKAATAAATATAKSSTVMSAAASSSASSSATPSKARTPKHLKKHNKRDMTRVEYEEDLLKDRLMADLDKLMHETCDSDEEAGDEFERAGTASISVAGSVVSDSSVAHFCGHPLAYKDFQTTETQVLKTQDYSWEDHGYALVSRFFPAAAPMLDDQFALTYNLTYNTFSSKEGIDTQPFRRAVWYYVHRVFGICNDDYDYREVNVFLPRAVKEYVKKAVCFPNLVTEEDFKTFSVVFRPDEKCHILLLALEARKQACLLYGLRAVMQHMT